MIKLNVKILTGKHKVLGLINVKAAYPILLKTRFGIHTFGLKFPIDVLVLDQDNKVVKLYKDLKPKRIFLWPPIFERVVELPIGEIEKRQIKLGSKIELEIA